MRAALLAMMVVCCAPRVHAQSPTTDATRAAVDTAWHGWLSLAVGPGGSSGQGRLTGDIALMFTHDRLALWGRMASASRFLDTGDNTDFSALVGVHPRTEQHTDVVVGAGLGMTGGRSTGGDQLAMQPALALGAQANINYRVVGVGIDAFATMSGARNYYGIGIAVALGAFR